jgi:hypothetical protein
MGVKMRARKENGKRTIRSKLAQTIAIALALILFAAPAVASTYNWAWTMNHRYVNGGSNGVYYTFSTGGTMTFAGSVWPYSKDGGANPAPMAIHLQVYRQNFPSDVVACQLTRTPSTTLYDHRYFNKYCGTEPDDTYYIVAWTVEDDGWNTKGAGTLKMP